MLTLGVIAAMVAALLHPTPWLGRVIAWLLRSLLTVITAAVLMRTVMCGQDQEDTDLIPEIGLVSAVSPCESANELKESSVFGMLGRLGKFSSLFASDSKAVRAVLDLDSACSVDNQLARFAANDDLGAFLGRWRASPKESSLSASTRSFLATAVRRAAEVWSDADGVLDVAVASGDAELADAALSAGTQLGCGSTWLARARTRLSAANVPIRAEHAVMLARIYGFENRGDLAVDLWQEQRAMDSLDAVSSDPTKSSLPVPAVDIYGAALEACVASGDLETAACAARSAGWQAPICSSGQAALLTIARWLARRQDVAHSLECYNSVCRIGGVVDFQTYRALLTACVRNGDLLQAAELFRVLSNAGLEPDFGIFATLIRGYCAAGELEHGMTLFYLLRRRGFVPDASLFDAILDGCARRNMTTLTEQVLKDMQAVGVSLSNQTIAILLRLFGRNRDLGRALQIFEELPKRNGLEVNTHTYRTLISVCLTNGRLDLAIEAFEKMQGAGCAADARTYEALVLGCLRQGDLDRAVDLIDSALGLSDYETAARDGSEVARACLEPKLVDDVLSLIGRRRQAQRLGAPLVRRLRRAGCEVSDHVAEAMLRIGHAQFESSCSLMATRRSERQLWRDLRTVTGRLAPVL